MGMEAPALEGGPKNDERHGRCCSRHLPDGLQDGLRHGNAEEQKHRSQNRPYNHGIPEHAEKYPQKIKLPAPKSLQYKNRQYIVDGNRHCDHHRRNSQRPIPKDVPHQGNSHNDIIAAVDGLDHRPSSAIFLFKGTDKGRGQRKNSQNPHRAEQHEPGLEAHRHIHGVDAVKHHAEEEHAKHHAVHMVQLFLCQEPVMLHHHSDEHEEEQRDHRAHRHDKIACHKSNPLAKHQIIQMQNPFDTRGQ